MTDTLPLQWFESGKTAMFYGGSWTLAEFKGNEYTSDQVDVAPLPQGEQRAVVIHGLANVVSAGTDQPDAAWEFVKYLGSEDAATVLANTGTVIPAYEGTQQAWVDASPDYDLQVFLDQTADAQPLPVSADTAVWNALEAEHLTEVWAGNADMTYWHVMLPLVRPGLIALGVLTSIWSWNELLWPLIVNTDPDKMTLSAGLTSLQGQRLTDFPVLMSGAIMASLPMIVLFSVMQRQFIASIASTGVKG